MLCGTGSSVGKSLLVAGLCRALLRRGLAVRPFKPQNMSNNAAIAEGGEIGRAQALQARAAGVAPNTDMNPVLLKPQSETGAQVIVQGRVVATARARAYQAMKPALMAPVLESFGRLSRACDIVVVEGAGSASEVNLRDGDIANLGFARATNTPVVVVGDIDRGGVIASLVGTHAVLAPEDAGLVRGFVVNRMRGDPTLFDAGRALIAARTGWRDYGLVAHFAEARLLPAEDAMDFSVPRRPGARLRIAVPVLPFIANFDDLDPLAAEPEVELVPVRPGATIPAPCDLVILPGSKATLADLAALRAGGLDIDIAAHRRRGGHVLGLCGGYQMLGRTVADPDGVEGVAGSVAGLGLLDVATVLGGDKVLAETRGSQSRVGRHLRATRSISARRPVPILRAPCCAMPTGGRTARSVRTGAWQGHTCMACSRTRPSARTGWRAWAGGRTGRSRRIGRGDARRAGTPSGAPHGYRRAAQPCARRMTASRATAQACSTQAVRYSASAWRMSAAVASLRPSPIQASATVTPP